MVSFRSFVVSGLIFKSLAYYELILVYFIPKYSIYFYAIINAIIFLISFTVCIEMHLFFLCCILQLSWIY